MKTQFIGGRFGRSLLGLAVASVCLVAFLRIRQPAPQPIPQISRAALPPVTRKVFQNGIATLSFSPDGKRLFATSNDMVDALTAKVLDAHSLSVLSNVSLPQSARTVALTDDWTKYIVCSSVPGPTTVSWPANSSRVRGRIRAARGAFASGSG